jgi:hypothetical protein
LAPPIIYGSLIQLFVYCYIKINRMLESALFDVTRHYVLFKPAIVRYCRYCHTFPGDEEKRTNPAAPPRLLFGLLSLRDRFADGQWHGVDPLCSGGSVLLASSVGSPTTTIVEDSLPAAAIADTPASLPAAASLGLSSSVDDLLDTTSGDRAARLFSYFVPAFLGVGSLPHFGCINSTTTVIADFTPSAASKYKGNNDDLGASPILADSLPSVVPSRPTSPYLADEESPLVLSSPASLDVQHPLLVESPLACLSFALDPSSGFFDDQSRLVESSSCVPLVATSLPYVDFGLVPASCLFGPSLDDCDVEMTEADPLDSDDDSVVDSSPMDVTTTEERLFLASPFAIGSGFTSICSPFGNANWLSLDAPCPSFGNAAAIGPKTLFGDGYLNCPTSVAGNHGTLELDTCEMMEIDPPFVLDCTTPDTSSFADGLELSSGAASSSLSGSAPSSPVTALEPTVQARAAAAKKARMPTLGAPRRVLKPVSLRGGKKMDFSSSSGAPAITIQEESSSIDDLFHVEVDRAEIESLLCRIHSIVGPQLY